MTRLQDILDREVPSYITPLFWQHGESESVLRQEMRQMSQNGISSFILESRPHPDFLGERWWHDLDVILDEARSAACRCGSSMTRPIPAASGPGASATATRNS